MNNIEEITRRLADAIECGMCAMSELAHQFQIVAKQTADLEKAIEAFKNLKEVNNA